MTRTRLLLVVWIMLCSSCTVPTLPASLEFQDEPAMGKGPAKDETEKTDPNHLESLRQTAGSSVAALARWFDSFFDDPDYSEEEADARISIRQRAIYTEKSDIHYRTRIRGALTFPKLTRKLKIILAGDDGLEVDESGEENLKKSTEESVDTLPIGLQWVFYRSKHFDLRMGTGVRVSEQSVYAGPRFRWRTDLSENWRTRFTQRVRYYSKDGWKSELKLNFDRSCGGKNLFRQTFFSKWQEKDYNSEGFEHTLTSAFIQPLSTSGAIHYSWSSVYTTDQPNGWRSTSVSIGYRTTIWRDWIVLDVTPFLSWEDQYDWDTNPGVMISLSLIIEEDKPTLESPRIP